MARQIRIMSAVLAAAVALPVGVSIAGAKKSRLAFADVNPRSASHGQMIDLDQLHAERGVVLRFIASWCDVCRKELPALEQLHAERGAPIVLVAADEHGPPDSLLIVAERDRLSVPILYVPEARAHAVGKRFDYEVLPATYVIDREGKLRLSHEGPLSVESLVRELESI